MTYSEVHCPVNGLIKQAVGSLCLVDGVAVEVMGMTVEDLKHKTVKDKSVGDEWQRVRGSVEKIISSDNLVVFKKQDYVRSQTFSGITIGREVAFITTKNFETFFGVPPGSPGVSAPLIELPMLQRGDCSGTIMELNDIPPTLAYEKVTTYTTSQRVLDSQLLCPAGVLRKKQALERYSRATEVMMKQRPQVLRSLPGSAPSFMHVKKECKKIEDDRAQLNAAQEAMGTAASAMIIASATINEDEDDFVPTRVGKSRGGAQTSTVGASVSRGRGRAAAAAGVGAKAGAKGTFRSSKQNGRGGGRQTGVDKAERLAASVLGGGRSARSGGDTPSPARRMESPPASGGKSLRVNVDKDNITVPEILDGAAAGHTRRKARIVFVCHMPSLYQFVHRLCAWCLSCVVRVLSCIKKQICS